MAVGLVVMTVLTVEAHLSRTYRNLGVRSRAALAGRLGSIGRAGPKQERAKVWAFHDFPPGSRA